MGTRTSLKKAGQPARAVHKRIGPVTDAERDLVAAVVLDQPGPLRSEQVTGLTKALRRSKDAVKEMIEDAQARFRANADRYVEVHMQAVEAGLASGNMTGLDIAMKGSQWAIERQSAEGARIIEPKAVEGANQGGPRVMIGVKIGSLDAMKDATVTAEVVDVQAQDGE